MNAIFRIGYFPIYWKIMQVILIPKPGKPPEEVTSYRPISLLPITFKLFEKLLLRRLKPAINDHKKTEHQFSFQQQTSELSKSIDWPIKLGKI
ncbi:hypothetical protein HZH66_010502 [Vespula vulgaris]|uniref:Reverse transcriptase n=1 Tax=Vespula vulgaris TaxID=7454 RepID=A0A834JJU3_VESVU|nr:hypothetical protein HZH66_010502 [Vespula vulgaris]